MISGRVSSEANMTKPFTVKATFIRDLPRLLSALIFSVSLSLLPSSALAQSEFVRSIASLQTRDLPTGSIVTITGDAALDGYTAYTSNDHFNVVIPRAVVSTPQKELRGRDFSECLVQQRNNVVLISFQTKPGSTVRVSQNFNRINVIFSSAGVSTTSADSKPSAIESKPEVLRIPKVSKAPTFYDFLVSRPREAEVVVTNFRQYEPGDGTPASQPTKAYLSYDESNLYVVFVCKDDRQKVRAHVARRES